MAPRKHLLVTFHVRHIIFKTVSTLKSFLPGTSLAHSMGLIPRNSSAQHASCDFWLYLDSPRCSRYCSPYQHPVFGDQARKPSPVVHTTPVFTATTAPLFPIICAQKEGVLAFSIRSHNFLGTILQLRVSREILGQHCSADLRSGYFRFSLLQALLP